MNRVIDYIGDHPGERLSLAGLAELAHFSPYHFHRLFKAATGETLNGFIRRSRMEQAVKRIRTSTGETLTEIALDLGFSSSANFSRDFRQFYGVPPSKVTAAIPAPCEAPLKPEACPEVPFQRFLREEGVPVLYNRVLTGYDPVKIKPAFQGLHAYASSAGLIRPDSLSLGVGLDDPDYTPWEKCRYDACLQIPADFQLPDSCPYNRRILPGGLHACFAFEGPAEEFRNAWDAVFHGWVLESDWLPDNRPHREIYLPSDRYREGRFRVELRLPVKPLDRKI